MKRLWRRHRLALGIVSGLMLTGYVVSAGSGEVTDEYGWLSVPVGADAVTVSTLSPGIGVGTRIDHADGSVTPLWSVFAGGQGVAVGAPGGICAGWSYRDGLWASASEC